MSILCTFYCWPLHTPSLIEVDILSFTPLCIACPCRFLASSISLNFFVPPWLSTLVARYIGEWFNKWDWQALCKTNLCTDFTCGSAHAASLTKDSSDDADELALDLGSVGVFPLVADGFVPMLFSWFWGYFAHWTSCG